MGSIIIYNANVIPMDDGKRYEAISIRDGIIDRVGSSEEVLAESFPSERIDAQGATVLPAFFDCHVHALTTGMNALAIDLYDVEDIPALLEILKKADAEYETGRWIFCKRFDESRIREGRPPVMDELDGILRPVFISDRGKHYTLVNRLAYDALGITDDIEGVRFDEFGKPNGRLQDQSNRTAQAEFFARWSPEERKKAIHTTALLAASRGITTVAAIEGLDSSDDDVPIIAEAIKELPIEMRVWWNTDSIQKPLAMGWKWWGGDFLLDGSIGSRTAAFDDRYSDADTRGYLNHTDEWVHNVIEQSLINDMAISFHCIGQSAIRQALDQMERTLETHPSKKLNHKLRLEHFGWADQKDIERCAKMNIKLSTQPSFTYLRGGPGSVYHQRLGDDRDRQAYPLRRFIDAGIVVGGGSDSDVTPMDALLGIHAAVNPPYPENALTAYEALRMYTSDASRVAFEDDRKGKIRIGLQGDLVILGGDPLTVDSKRIKDIKILFTIHKGKIIYQG
jgi:predicted amidohydrolase YtcJ